MKNTAITSDLGLGVAFLNVTPKTKVAKEKKINWIVSEFNKALL